MHPSARKNFELFLKMVPSNQDFLEIGSYNVNGSLRESVTDFKSYTGLDIEMGPGVDFVYSPGETFPFPDKSFDVVSSSSCFEHDPVFWLTFKEMVRVLRPGGLMYINAPSEGSYHAYPVDCWRFYLDSWAALAKTCPDITLIKSYIDPEDTFKDSVGIYKK